MATVYLYGCLGLLIEGIKISVPVISPKKHRLRLFNRGGAVFIF